MRKTEMTRLVELGNSFIQLGNALQQMEVQPPGSKPILYRRFTIKYISRCASFVPRKVGAGRKKAVILWKS